MREELSLSAQKNASAAKDFDLKGKRKHHATLSFSSFLSLKLSARKISDKGWQCINFPLNAECMYSVFVKTE